VSLNVYPREERIFFSSKPSKYYGWWFTTNSESAPVGDFNSKAIRTVYEKQVKALLKKLAPGWGDARHDLIAVLAYGSEFANGDVAAMCHDYLYDILTEAFREQPDTHDEVLDALTDLAKKTNEKDSNDRHNR
jgi:hypothetical protein